MNILAIRMLAKTDNRQLHYRNVFLVKHACDYASLIAPTGPESNGIGSQGGAYRRQGTAWAVRPLSAWAICQPAVGGGGKGA